MNGERMNSQTSTKQTKVQPGEQKDGWDCGKHLCYETRLFNTFTAISS